MPKSTAGARKLTAYISSNSQLQVLNCYKMKNSAPPEVKPPTPAPKQRDVQPRPIQSVSYLGDTVEEAAASAAYKIADAENKSSVAAESVREAERVARMAEDMEALLQFAMDCFEQSTHFEPQYLFLTPLCLLHLYMCKNRVFTRFRSYWQVLEAIFC